MPLTRSFGPYAGLFYHPSPFLMVSLEEIREFARAAAHRFSTIGGESFPHVRIAEKSGSFGVESADDCGRCRGRREHPPPLAGLETGQGVRHRRQIGRRSR